jgi:CubicO group peptidase (beta-lactamase class C family)
MNALLRSRLLSLAVLLLLAAVFVPLPALAEQPPSSKSITAALQPFVDSHSLAGAVTLVADKDKVLSLEAVGFADLAAKKPMATDSLFWIASQSKPITASALMILVDEGKVKLDDPVEKYLPEFKGQWLAAYSDANVMLLKKPKHPITVRNILSHTSGLPFRSAMEQPTLDGLPLRDAVRSYAMTPLQFEPGTRFLYSNAGINTAGRIIEVVSGMPYEAFLDKRLFGPLGMKDTTFWPNEKQLERLAKTYKPNKAKTGLEETTIGQLKYPLNDRKRQPMPAGGLFSTAADVGRFCQMILNDGKFNGKKILSKAAVKEMTRKQTGDAVKVNYGLGWSVDGRSFGHGGAAATNMTIDRMRKRGQILVWMVQQVGGFPGNGDKSQGAFKKAVDEQLRSAKPGSVTREEISEQAMTTDRDWENEPLSALDLSPRVSVCLRSRFRRLGVQTLGQLCRLSVADAMTQEARSHSLRRRHRRDFLRRLALA